MLSFVKAVESVLKDYANTQVALNYAIELIPNENDKKAYVFKRAALRSDAKKILSPLALKFQNLSDDLGPYGTYVVPYRDMLAKAIYEQATGLDICEKQLTDEILNKYKKEYRKKSSALGGFFSSDPYEGKSDIEIGKLALTYFFNRASTYPDFKYGSVDEMTSFYSKDPNIIYDGFGSSIKMESIDESALQNAMELLADKGAGQIPSSSATFFMKLTDITSNPSLLDALSFTASETAQQVGEGIVEAAQNVGTGVISTLKSASFLTKYLPWVLVAAGAGYLYIASAPLRLSLKRKK